MVGAHPRRTICRFGLGLVEWLCHGPGSGLVSWPLTGSTAPEAVSMAGGEIGAGRLRVVERSRLGEAGPEDRGSGGRT